MSDYGRVFDEELIKKSTNIPWYIKIILFFLPTYVAVDDAYTTEDTIHFIWYRKLFGVIYVVDSDSWVDMALPERHLGVGSINASTIQAGSITPDIDLGKDIKP